MTGASGSTAESALVTGSASGIGAATARVFAEAGADVVAGWYSSDPHDVDQTRAAVENVGRRCLVEDVDVADTDSVDAVVVRTIEEFGRIDIVVANAAVARDVPSPELDDERWNSLLEVDLSGVFRCFRAAMPHMIQAGWGRLLATSSIAGAYQGGRATRTTRRQRPALSDSFGRWLSSWARTGSRRTRSLQA